MIRRLTISRRQLSRAMTEVVTLQIWWHILLILPRFVRESSTRSRSHRIKEMRQPQCQFLGRDIFTTTRHTFFVKPSHKCRRYSRFSDSLVERTSISRSSLHQLRSGQRSKMWRHRRLEIPSRIDSVGGSFQYTYYLPTRR